MSELSSTWPH